VTPPFLGPHRLVLSSRPDRPPFTLSSRPERSEVEGPAVPHGAASFHFVIPTGAKRSGGTSSSSRIVLLSLCHPDRSEAKWRDQQFLTERPPFTLSSRPERSAVEGPAVPHGAASFHFVIPTGAKRSGGTCSSSRIVILSLCHPDRSEAQWRDLQFLTDRHPFTLSSRPERSAAEGPAVPHGSSS
jgi:hypothetical protein